MERRDFLRIVGAASLTPATAAAIRRGSAHPLLQRCFTTIAPLRSIASASTPAGETGALWVRKRDLPRVNGFELKPQGACRADLCIPIPKTMTRGDYFNLTAFAKKAGQPVVAEPSRAGVELRRDAGARRRALELAHRA